MRRYIAIYLAFVRFGFSQTMEFRVDFGLRIVMDCFYYAANFLFFRTVLNHTPLLGGWNEPQVMVFVSGVVFCDAICMTLFSNNNHAFPTLISQGQMDYYLVRPVSSMFMATMRDFGAASFINFLIASGILVWALVTYPAPIALFNFVAYAAALILGVAIWQGMTILLIYIPAFWTTSVLGFMDLHYTLRRLGERPDGIFRQGIVRVVLTTVLPYGVMTSFPTRILFDDMVWQRAWHMLAVALGVFVVVGSLWRLGLRAYASASS